MVQTLGEPEDEIVVHDVCARVPPFSQKMGRPDRESQILMFDLSPVRFHYGKRANYELGLEQRKPPVLFIRFTVAQEFKRVQKSSLFPSGSTTRKSLILPSKFSGGDWAFIPLLVISS